MMTHSSRSRCLRESLNWAHSLTDCFVEDRPAAMGRIATVDDQAKWGIAPGNNLQTGLTSREFTVAPTGEWSAALNPPHLGRPMEFIRFILMA